MVEQIFMYEFIYTPCEDDWVNSCKKSSYILLNFQNMKKVRSFNNSKQSIFDLPVGAAILLILVPVIIIEEEV